MSSYLKDLQFLRILPQISFPLYLGQNFYHKENRNLYLPAFSNSSFSLDPFVQTIQALNSIPRTSLCLHVGILLSTGFAVLFHFSSLRGAPGTHAASDHQIFILLPPQSLVLLLADQIGRRPSPVAFFFSFLLSSQREISSHHYSDLLSYLQRSARRSSSPQQRLW